MCDGEFFNRHANEDGEFEEQIKLENRVEKYVAEKIGCKMHTQRDPRGHAVRLELKTYSNCWDGTTAPAW